MGQGFDWEYSYKLPYAIPDKFIGASVGYSFNFNQGNFAFLEDYVYCCNFEKGNGNSINFGLIGEYWLEGNQSILVNLNFINTKSKFTQTINIPRSDGTYDYVAKYEYTLDDQRNLANLWTGLKYRLFNSFYSIIMGIGASFYINSSATHTEKIISPESEYFIDGSRQRVILKGSIPNHNAAELSATFGLGYDYSLYRNYYLSFNPIISIPLTNVIKNENWKEWKISINMFFFKAIN